MQVTGEDAIIHFAADGEVVPQMDRFANRRDITRQRHTEADVSGCAGSVVGKESNCSD